MVAAALAVSHQITQRDHLVVVCQEFFPGQIHRHHSSSLVVEEVHLQEAHLPMAVAAVAVSALEMALHTQTAQVVVELLLLAVRLRLQQRSAQLRQRLVAHSRVVLVRDIQLPITKVAVVVEVVSTVEAVDTVTVLNQTAAVVVDPVISTLAV